MKMTSLKKLRNVRKYNSKKNI